MAESPFVPGESSSEEPAERFGNQSDEESKGSDESSQDEDEDRSAIPQASQLETDDMDTGEVAESTTAGPGRYAATNFNLIQFFECAGVTPSMLHCCCLQQ